MDISGPDSVFNFTASFSDLTFLLSFDGVALPPFGIPYVGGGAGMSLLSISGGMRVDFVGFAPKGLVFNC